MYALFSLKIQFLFLIFNFLWITYRNLSLLRSSCRLVYLAIANGRHNQLRVDNIKNKDKDLSIRTLVKVVIRSESKKTNQPHISTIFNDQFALIWCKFNAHFGLEVNMNLLRELKLKHVKLTRQFQRWVHKNKSLVSMNHPSLFFLSLLKKRDRKREWMVQGH